MSLDQEILFPTQDGLIRSLGLPPEILEIWKNNPEVILSLLGRRGPLLTVAVGDYFRAEHARQSSGDKTYRVVLLAFQAFLLDRWRGTPEDTWTVDRIKRTDVDTFVTRKKADGTLRMATTCNKDLAIVRSFLWWLLETERVFTNCAQRIKRQREPKSLPVALSPEEQSQVLELCKKSREGARNYTMVNLGLQTGLRVHEACGLTWDMFDFTNRWVTVVGKGNVERRVPLLPSVVEQLLDYRDTYWRRQIAAPNAVNHVFRNAGGRHWGMPITVDGAEAMFGSIMRTIGRPPGQNFHVLRHTFAVNLVLAGVKVVHIKKLLGHSLLETTGKYTKIADKELARVMAAHFPSGTLVPRSPNVDFNPEIQSLITQIMKE